MLVLAISTLIYEKVNSAFKGNAPGIVGVKIGTQALEDSVFTSSFIGSKLLVSARAVVVVATMVDVGLVIIQVYAATNNSSFSGLDSRSVAILVARLACRHAVGFISNKPFNWCIMVPFSLRAF